MEFYLSEITEWERDEFDTISRSFCQRERKRERFVLKAYRKLVDDFPHDSSMNVEPSMVGWKNDEKFSTEFLRPSESSYHSKSAILKNSPTSRFTQLLFSFIAQVRVRNKTELVRPIWIHTCVYLSLIATKDISILSTRTRATSSLLIYSISVMKNMKSVFYIQVSLSKLVITIVPFSY